MRLLTSILVIIAVSIALKFQFNTDTLSIFISVATGLYIFANVSFCYILLQDFSVKSFNKKSIIIFVTFIIVIIFLISLSYLIYIIADTLSSISGSFKHVFTSLVISYVISIIYYLFVRKKLNN